MEPSGIPHHQDYLKAVWDGITVEYMRSNETGDYDATFPQQTIGVALAPQERVVWRVDVGLVKRLLCCPEAFFFTHQVTLFGRIGRGTVNVSI